MNPDTESESKSSTTIYYECSWCKKLFKEIHNNWGQYYCNECVKDYPSD